MPSFDTPESIAVTLDLSIASVRFTASERTDTVVEVRPTDESDESDVQAAAQVRVDHTGGTLRITGPKRIFDFSRKSRSVDVTVNLPIGSQISADLQMGDISCAGRLGQCRLKTSAGSFRVEQTGPLRLDTSAGNVSADEITGTAEISTGSGKVEIGRIDGTAVIKNSNGDTTVGTVTGDVRVRAANGDITVDHAGAGVDAKTSNGSISLGEVVRGAVTLGTAMGNLQVGIADGTAAWLEVNTGFGHVRNLLENATRPEEADNTVEVRGRTSYGDITIRRS